MKILSAVVLSASILILSTIVDLGCGPPRSPSGGADAGAGPGLCTRLEGVTDNQTIIAICASVEEIAYIVSILGPILAAGNVDGGACAAIPTTSVCATPLQIGRGIQAVLEKRRGLLLLDAGARRDAGSGT